MSATKPQTDDLGGALSALLFALEGRMRRIAEEVAHGDGGAPPASPLELIDEKTRCEISEHALLSHKTYLTRKEAAKYLSVSERSISEWAARPLDQNPFPERHAGSEPRARRTDIDEWAARENQRQRLKLAG